MNGLIRIDSIAEIIFSTIIEKTETIIKEQPVTIEKIINEIKEVALTDDPVKIATKLNTLTAKVEKKVIIGLEDWMSKVQKNLEKKTLRDSQRHKDNPLL